MATVIAIDMNNPLTQDTATQQHGQATGNVAESLMPPEDITKNLVQLFKLLSDETRLKILYFLMNQEELNVRTLCEMLGQSQPAVSHHLALLRVAGLIESRRDGKHNFYHLLPQRFQELLGMVFTKGPEKNGGSIRLEDFVLSYSQVSDAP
jgi:ArsR family transcriptional regulator